MGRDHRSRPQTKRRFRQFESVEDDELETVDDLAHAAQFAILPAVAATTVPVLGSFGPGKKGEDDNEIEVGDGDDNCDAFVAPSNDNATHEDDDSESDESELDEDLTEALKRMEDATAEEEAHQLTMTANPPKTENEVDGYKVPIQELESQLQIQLTVQGGLKTKVQTNNCVDITMNDVSLAGKVKNYMLLDRTVVVESVTKSFHTQQQRGIGPLDEGTLLIVQKPDGNSDDSKIGWIPLGRIFEVFGPVSQPLYTIRLPSPPSNEKGKKSMKKNIKKNASTKCNEVSGEQEIDSGGDETKIVAHLENDKRNTLNKGINEANVSDVTAENVELSTEGCEPITNGEGEKHEEGDPAIQSNVTSQSLPSDIEENSTHNQPKESAESKSEDSASINEENEGNVIDPWAMDGEYAKFISHNKDIQVYYIQDEAKLIDTNLVLRNSGKGCDASNIHDEEILDSSEAYYSDDEKEREAKNKKRGATRKKSQLSKNNRQQHQHVRPRNHHPQRIQQNSSRRENNITGVNHGQPPPPPHPPSQGYSFGQHAGHLPQGFYHTAQQNVRYGAFQQSSPLYQYPPQSSFHRQTSIPPPPPPPPRPNQPYPNQDPNSLTNQSQANLPPRNPNEPPAYQY